MGKLLGKFDQHHGQISTLNSAVVLDDVSEVEGPGTDSMSSLTGAPFVDEPTTLSELVNKYTVASTFALSYGDDVLSPAALWQGVPSSGSRADHVGHLCRPALERKGGELCRRPPATLQKHRSHGGGDTLVSSTENGGPLGKGCSGGSERRDQECAAGQLRGVTYHVVGEPPEHRDAFLFQQWASVISVTKKCYCNVSCPR